MSNQAGLIETIQDAISIHSIKNHGKKALDPNQKSYSLTEYYMTVFIVQLTNQRNFQIFTLLKTVS